MNSLAEAPLKTVIRQPAEEAFAPCFGGQMNIFLTGAQSGGWLTAALHIAPPDNGPPYHLHRREDELLIVVEGTFSFFADGKWTEAGPGTVVFLPRDQPHAFRNTGKTTGKLYVLAQPPGLETFFERCDEPFHRPEGPDFKEITSIGADHGIEFVRGD